MPLSSWSWAHGALRAQQGQSQSQVVSPSQRPQEPPLSSGKIAVQVKAVTLYATVRDKHGKIVPDLNKDDFSVQDQGSPQTISYFARESDLPLTLGPLVDTSLSQRDVLGAERDASYAFLDRMLRPETDKAFLIHFDREVELLQDLTASREKLKHAIQELAPPDPDDNSGSQGGGSRGHGRGGHSYRGKGTLLYDAIYLASNEVIKKQQGRKALIVLTDGVDHGSDVSLGEAISAAQRADAAVYSIYFPGEEGGDRGGYQHHGGMGGGAGGPFPWPGGGPGAHGGGGQRPYPEHEQADGKKVLEQISSETGGRFFQVSKKLPVDQIYAQIEEELRNQYSFGYTPSPADSGGGYHKIHLSVKDKNLTVVTRDGYYAGL